MAKTEHGPPEPFDPVYITVTGTPVPYRERTSVFKRAKEGRGGQPIGSVGVASRRPAGVVHFQNHLRQAAQEAMDGRELITGPVRLTVRVYVEIPKSMPKWQLQLIHEGLWHPTKRPDFVNFWKAAEDALKSRVWHDDSQVVRGSDAGGKFYSHRPRLEIIVAPVTFCKIAAREFQDISKVNDLTYKAEGTHELRAS